MLRIPCGIYWDVANNFAMASTVNRLFVGTSSPQLQVAG